MRDGLVLVAAVLAGAAGGLVVLVGSRHHDEEPLPSEKTTASAAARPVDRTQPAGIRTPEEPAAEVSPEPPRSTRKRAAPRAAEEEDEADESESAAAPFADPALNADPKRREAVRQSVLDLRRTLIEHDLRYDMGFNKLAPPDPSRLERLPDERVWPNRLLGQVQRDPAKYEILAPDAKAFDPTRGERGWVFTTPLDHPIATEKSGVTLLFEQGIGVNGIVTMQGGGTIRCRGPMSGKLYLMNYTTLIVDGDLTGSVESSSYVTIHVTGRFTGSFESKSYANLRVMGGFAGRMNLFDGNNLYFAGYTPLSALDAIESMDRTTIVLERSDMAAGALSRKPRIEVTVLGR